MDTETVLRFLSDHQSRGEPAILVIVGAVEGSSMRNPGTIMGVAQDGSFTGSLSGGCIENAVVAEALDLLQAGASGVRVVRFGAGSPYLDIKLPCGGGLDLSFTRLEASPLPDQCLAAIAAREPFALCLDRGAASFESGWLPAAFNPETHSGRFGYWPAPRLVIIGHGAGVEALARLGGTMGCAIEVLSPDNALCSSLSDRGVPATNLEKVTQTQSLCSDAWTAIVFLFHDHDWETHLMQHALSLSHFYLGAMGGRQAHIGRCETLAERGVSEDQLAKIRAPIGLFHSSRDPQTLALSTLAEVIRAYENADFEAAIG